MHVVSLPTRVKNIATMSRRNSKRRQATGIRARVWASSDDPAPSTSRSNKLFVAAGRKGRGRGLAWFVCAAFPISAHNSRQSLIAEFPYHSTRFPTIRTLCGFRLTSHRHCPAAAGVIRFRRINLTTPVATISNARSASTESGKPRSPANPRGARWAFLTGLSAR